MTLPIQIAAIGAGLIFAIYLLFKDRNTSRPLTYGAHGGGGGDDNIYTYKPPSYDTHPLHTNADNSTSTIKECVICLTEITENERQRILGCKHVFHEDCIRQWLAEDRICPICRKYA